jgi:hypothetical protein
MPDAEEDRDLRGARRERQAISVHSPTAWPAPLAEIMKLLPGVSERALRRKVRELNCCSIIGSKIYLDATDFQILLDATRPRPSKPRGPEVSPAWVGLFEPNSYEKALALASKSMPKNSKYSVKGHLEKRKKQL